MEMTHRPIDPFDLALAATPRRSAPVAPGTKRVAMLTLLVLVAVLGLLAVVGGPTAPGAPIDGPPSSLERFAPEHSSVDATVGGIGTTVPGPTA